MSTQALTKPADAAAIDAPSLLDRITERQALDATRYKPVMSVDESIARYKSIEKFVAECMKEGVDYGKPPGFPKESKPFLYKAGAQKLCAFFAYVPNYIELECIEEWSDAKYGEPLFYYKFSCTLSKNGEPVGQGIGSCNSWETKYRYRNSSRTCPECGAESIIKGKAEYGGGFLCFAKKGGCGAKFKDDDPAILEQETGKVANPDIADTINTVQKQGEKRAYVEATLSATGASAFFTQDEDTVEPPKAVPRTPRKAGNGGVAGNAAPSAASAEGTPSRPVPEELKVAIEALRRGDGSHVKTASTFLEEECATLGIGEAFSKLSRAVRLKFPKGTAIPHADMENFMLDVWDQIQAYHAAHQPGTTEDKQDWLPDNIGGAE